MKAKTVQQPCSIPCKLHSYTCKYKSKWYASWDLSASAWYTLAVGAICNKAQAKIFIVCTVVGLTLCHTTNRYRYNTACHAQSEPIYAIQHDVLFRTCTDNSGTNMLVLGPRGQNCVGVCSKVYIVFVGTVTLGIRICSHAPVCNYRN